MQSDHSSHNTYYAARGVFAVAAVFGLVVSTLLIADYVQLKTVDPLGSPVLQQLKERLSKDPADRALREQIRALDLLARKAYFVRRSQIETGGYLLLAAVIVMLAAAKIMAALRPKTPDPREFDQSQSTVSAQKFTLAFALSLFAFALVLAFSARREPDTAPALPAEAKTADIPPTLPAPLEDIPDEVLANWPSFRGPYGHGVSGEVISAAKVLWKTAVPREGFSSPIVWGNRLFLSGADEKVRELYCFDASTGDMLWQREVKDVEGSPEQAPDVSRDTGYAASTAATDGRRVCAIFATGDMACYGVDGEKQWARNLGVPENHYGHSSSLALSDNLLLVQFDHAGGAKLMALSADTGDTVWEKNREVDPSWASPLIVKDSRRSQVVLLTCPTAASYDIETGEELWQTECMGGEVAPSPAYADGLVFVANVGICAAAIDVDSGKIVWEIGRIELPEVASPLATGDYLFLAGSEGGVTCLRAKTGEILWRHEYQNGFYASPVAAGDVVYLLDRSGVLHKIKADGRHIPAGEFDFGEAAVSTPAIANGRIYVRTLRNLFCVGPEPTEPE